MWVLTGFISSSPELSTYNQELYICPRRSLVTVQSKGNGKGHDQTTPANSLIRAFTVGTDSKIQLSYMCVIYCQLLFCTVLAPILHLQLS